MRTIPSNQAYPTIGVVLTVLILFWGSTAYSQMIRLQLTIPSGTDIGLVPIDPRIINPPTNNSNRANKSFQDFKTLGIEGNVETDSILRSYTRWIELRSRENNELLVHVRYETDSLVYPVFVLNNGTSDFNAAVRLRTPTHFNHYKPSVTMRSMPSKTLHFTAWLGVPMLTKSYLIIEYT